MISDLEDCHRLTSERTSTGRISEQFFPHTLADLLGTQEILGSEGDLKVGVNGICIDSRKVVPGNLFFALSGRLTDGNLYIDEAIRRGAGAIVSAAPPKAGGPTFVQVKDARETLARVSRRFCRHPDQEMRVIGVTGTNGKTSVTMLARHLINGPENIAQTALLGTIHYDIGGKIIPSKRTTPEAHELYDFLGKSRDSGCTRAIMEVSSHGVSQKRVLGMEFETAVFLNLTPEHLDYHQSMEQYYQAKKQFICGGNYCEAPRQVVVNINDAYGERLLSELPGAIKAVTFAEEKEADLQAVNIRCDSAGTQFLLNYPGGSIHVRSPLLGRFNVQNLLAAIAIGWVEGCSIEEMISRLDSFSGVPGRLERIQMGQDFNVIVDYAHTDDALENILSVLREVTVGRLLLVFGCGGDRDQDKRPAMTQTAQKFCDFVWATADNPRSEPLSSIFEHMKAGITDPDRITFVKDRRHAIGLAMNHAKVRDCLVIAGKGHETYQEYSDTVIPFDDRRVAEELLTLRRSMPGL